MVTAAPLQVTETKYYTLKCDLRTRLINQSALIYRKRMWKETHRCTIYVIWLCVISYDIYSTALYICHAHWCCARKRAYGTPVCTYSVSINIIIFTGCPIYYSRGCLPHTEMHKAILCCIVQRMGYKTTLKLEEKKTRRSIEIRQLEIWHIRLLTTTNRIYR